MPVRGSAAPTGRPRDPAVDGRALRAAHELFVERGWSGVTFDEVAKRAGVGKSSLYLRWASKAELIVAAVDLSTGDLAQINTGTLRGDLVQLAREQLEAHWSGAGLAAFRLAIEARHVPELRDAVAAVRYQDSVRNSRTIVRRGIRRGELPPSASPTLVGDLIAGSILIHVMATPAHLSATVKARSKTYVESLVDTVLAGVRATV